MKFWIFLLFISASIVFSADTKKITIVFSGNNNGKYRGCGWENNQNGGLARRKTFFDAMRAKNDNVLFLDTGDILNPYTENPKDIIVAKCYEKLNYDAIGIGDQEFIAGRDFFDKYLLNKLPLISANLAFSDDKNSSKIKKEKIFQMKNGLKVGVTSVNFFTGFRYLVLSNTIKENLLDIGSAIKGLRSSIKRMKEQNVDLIIVLGHLSVDGTAKLLDSSSGYNLFIGGHNSVEYKHERLIEDKILVQNGNDGENVGVVDFVIENKKVISHKYKLVPIDENVYIKDAKMDKFILDMQKELKIEDSDE